MQLTSAGWKNWGAKARQARKGYDLGWAGVLDQWAGRRSATVLLCDALMVVALLQQRIKGGLEADIARAGGRITAD